MDVQNGKGIRKAIMQMHYSTRYTPRPPTESQPYEPAQKTEDIHTHTAATSPPAAANTTTCYAFVAEPISHKVLSFG